MERRTRAVRMITFERMFVLKHATKMNKSDEHRTSGFLIPF